jgi:alpha-galactosidase
MMAAPLIAGNDVAHMDESTRSILLNEDVIAVDQDPLGVQGKRVAKDGGSEVWVKPLAGGAHAVLLFNRGDQPATFSFAWADLGLALKRPPRARDLWAQKDVVKRAMRYSATVEPHGVAMFKVQP